MDYNYSYYLLKKSIKLDYSITWEEKYLAFTWKVTAPFPITLDFQNDIFSSVWNRVFHTVHYWIQITTL